ncbi:MAG: endopeptidase La [Rhodanobacteraceae bacterium]
MSETEPAAEPQRAVVESRPEDRPRPERLAILPLREQVLFPQLVMPLTFPPDTPVAAIQRAIHDEQPVGLLFEAVAEATPANEPSREGDGDAHADDAQSARDARGAASVGVAANILRYMTGNDGQHYLVCQGLARFRVVEVERDKAGALTARVEWIDEPQPTGDREVDARVNNLRERAVEIMKLMPQVPEGLVRAIRSVDSAPLLADAIAGYLGLKPSEQQQVLETTDLIARLDKVQVFLDYRLDVLRLSRDISHQTQERMGQRQRDAMLREQMRSIQRELGDDDGRGRELEDLRKSLEAAGLPEQARNGTDRELKRLERVPEDSVEYSMVRTYLEWMAELPWSKLSADKLDIPAARAVLDEDHYGLVKIKRRILEHLAVHKLNPRGGGSILCFVGPPGVGKTSLGQSIARAMGRKFVRTSLGGVSDEAEIRGHRRTYVGALPGKIISGLKTTGTRNPVFMLDEIDKLSNSFRGDPAAALLEVLDPEQNDSFTDNYLGVPFDLSQVMFIATANVLDTVPGPLRDRMEVLALSGYSREEKLEIARRYLIRREVAAAGLTAEQCEITDAALTSLIGDYTREAGVRNLEREIAAIARHVAMQVAQGDTGTHRIDARDLHDILGPRRFENEVALRTSMPGVSTGLAWTPQGGDILFIEASRAPGNGRLTLTGQLGDVMKESAQAALSLAKAHAQVFGIDPAEFERNDIHVHVPAGAIRKDGPSAGLAMYTALVSMLTERPVHPDVAMTGEISLRGLVLPIGGLKEKTLAAHQAGIKTVLLPARNRKDAEEIPDVVQRELNIEWIDQADDGVRKALQPAPASAT